MKCLFEIKALNDTEIVIHDLNINLPVSQDLDNVIKWLNLNTKTGVGNRRVFFYTKFDLYCEINLNKGLVTGVTTCSDAQRLYFKSLIGV